MAVRVAINGFGRIGRNTLKAAWDRLKGFNIVAINDLTDTKTLAHLLKYDTMYGIWDHEIDHDETGIIIDGKRIEVTAERNPADLPWKKKKVDLVLECTGIFRTEEKASAHLDAGAKLVVISAPAKGGDVPTYVLGVNADGKTRFGKQPIINNASCTTNCIAPVTKAIDRSFGIKRAYMTTIHSYTADQNIQDGPHKDLRRARAAAQNIVPTTTGAANATTKIMPQLKGKFDGMAIRVPTAVVSLADFTILLKKKTTTAKVNAALKRAAEGKMFGILEVSGEPLVSSDYIGANASSIVDLGMTKVIQGDFLKLVAWYDNEWGYSMRLADMALLFAKKKLGKK